MIELSREKNPNYQFEVAGLFESEFPDAQIITMIGEILSYASYGQNDLDSKLKSFFTNISSKLIDNGVLLFDILTDNYDYNYSSFFDSPEYTLSMKSSQENTTVTREIISFLKSNNEISYTKSKEIHHLIVFNIEKIMEILFEVGLEVKVLDNYQNFPLLPGRKACFCRVHNNV